MTPLELLSAPRNSVMSWPLWSYCQPYGTQSRHDPLGALVCPTELSHVMTPLELLPALWNLVASWPTWSSRQSRVMTPLELLLAP